MSTLLTRAFWKAVLITVAIACVYVIGKPYTEREVDPGAVRNYSGNTVLFDHRAECWVTGPAKAEIPTHVVMRIEGGTRGGHWFYGGKHYVDIALIDVFEKDNPRVFVKAFCV